MIKHAGVLIFIGLVVLVLGAVSISCLAANKSSNTTATIISSDDGSREASYPLQALPAMTSKNSIKKTFRVDNLRDVSAANILMYAVLNDFTLDGQFGFEHWEWIFISLNGHDWVARPQDTDFERVYPFRPTWVNTKWRGIAIPDVRWLKTGENELVIWNNNLPGKPTNKFLDIGIDTQTKNGRSQALYKGEWSLNHLRGETGKPANGWDSNLPVDDGTVQEGEYMIRLELLKTPLSVAKKMRLATDIAIRDSIAKGGRLLVAEVEPTEKVCPNKPFEGRIPARLRVDVAGGERECIQLALWALSDELKEVEIKIEGIPSKPGITWSISRIGYTNVRGEEWPDPLFPLDKQFSIKAGGIQPILITFSTDKDGSPGLFKGKLIVSAAGTVSKSIPIEIKRHKFNLSEPGRLPFVIGLDYGIPAHYSLIKEHRMTMFSCSGGSIGLPEITLQEDGSITCNWESFKQKVKDFDKEKQGSALGLGWVRSWWGTTINPPAKNTKGEITSVNVDPFGDATSKTRFNTIISGYQKALSELGWDSRSYFYADDEPQNVDLVAQWTAAIKTAAPKLKTLVTCGDVPPQWKGKVDAYCINTNGFVADKYPAQIKEAGGELWLYTCTNLGRPALTIPNNSGPVRYFPWLAMRYGAKGLLHWAVNYQDQNTPAARQFEKPGVDALGDGTLFYTTEDGRGLSSLRAEAIRDGLEDYEYTSLLQGYNDRKALSLLEEARNVVPGGGDRFMMIPNSVSRLVDLKRRIGDYLDSKIH